MSTVFLLAGGISTGLLVGGVFGARHALEVDHVAAVATLVKNKDRPVLTGAAWGIGHSIPIVLLGVFFLVLDLRIPSRVATAFEVFVAILLVALGLRVIAGRDSLGLTIFRHVHGHNTGNGHYHFTIRGNQIGFTHSHADEESMAVGIVHGLAGSGGVVVALAAASPTISRGIAFLIGFSLASVAAMGLASWLWGQVIGHAAKLRIGAGLVSILVGLVLFTEILGLTIPG